MDQAALNTRHGIMKHTKPYWEMTANELAKATAEFDEDFVIEKTKPLSAKDKAQHARARRKQKPPLTPPPDSG